MSSDGKGDVTMIGMHSLASLTADGLVPELQALVSYRGNQWTFRNVVAFPLELTRFPGEAPVVPLGPDAESGANVIVFAQRSRKILGRFRKS